MFWEQQTKGLKQKSANLTKKYYIICFIYKGGYKGYGLAMMVEILCGVLSGGAFGPNVRTWRTHEKPANLVSFE